MGTYPYFCSSCSEGYDVIKSYTRLDEIENCPKCALQMERHIAAVRSNRSNCQFQAHYNPAFGKKIHTKTELDETVRRMRGETGKDIVEVGNDTLQSVKKPYKKVTDDEIREVYNSAL